MIKNPLDYLEKETLTETELSELEVFLNTASDLYYNSDSKIISDEDFDKIKDLYERASGELLAVGAAAPEGKGTINVSHKYPELVGTLAKVNNINELYDWFNKLQIPKDSEILISRKFDGNSVTIEFDGQGNVLNALTRGRDGKGMDLSHIFKDYKINNILKKDMAIKYEVLITYDNFDKYIEEKGVSYANPRSVVSGILGRDDAYDYKDFLTLVPLELKTDETISRKKQVEILKSIYSSGVSILDNIKTTTISNREYLEEVYGSYTVDFRSTLNYMIDGLVIEILDDQIRENLGYGSGRPNYAIALKFPYMEKQTKVIRVEFDFGLTGQITPVVCYEPVEFNGAIQKRTSIASYKRFKELKLGEGSDIIIQYRNEVLSYIEKLDTPYNDKVEAFEFTKECPICNGDIDIITNSQGEETLAFCANDECEGKTSGRITRYLKKVDIKGVAAKSVEKMVESGTISTIEDLYTLTPEDIDYFGPVQSQKIIDAIHAKKNDNIYDYEILAGIGIKDLGKTNSKLLCKHWTIDEILSKGSNLKQELLQLDGIADITADILSEGFVKFKKELVSLANHINPKSYKNDFKADETTYTICITGKLFNSNRDELKAILETRGHKVSGTVSSKTDFLVNNDIESNSSKNKKAKDLGKDIITEKQLYDKLGL